MALDIAKIKSANLSADQYLREDCSALKKQIVIHHTAGAPSPENVVHGWQFTRVRVGTAFLIAGKETKRGTHQIGDIYQAFSSKYYAYHIAFSKSTNKVPAKYHSWSKEVAVAKASIGIEICNWGQLIQDEEGNFRNYVNGIVPADEVMTFDEPFRGYVHYHKYSDEQLDSTKDLVLYLCEKYNIPKVFNEDMFDINTRALEGEAGIWTHASYRSDKNDCPPQPNLVKMLREIAA